MRQGNVSYLERLAALTPKTMSDSCANVPQIAQELTKGFELAFSRVNDKELNFFLSNVNPKDT